jgi:hypothetical protein
MQNSNYLQSNNNNNSHFNSSNPEGGNRVQKQRPKKEVTSQQRVNVRGLEHFCDALDT